MTEGMATKPEGRATTGPWKLRFHRQFTGAAMYWLNARTSIGTENKADAILCVAAPQMLAALKLVVSDLSHDGSPASYRAMAAANEAITAAEIQP